MPNTYSVLVTDGNNCHGSSSTVVNLVEPPLLKVTPDGPTTFCNGDSVILTASGAINYVWNTDANIPSITVKNQGLYTVTANNAAGCDISVLVYVTVNPLPFISITSSGSTTFCQGGSITLKANGAGTYAWNNNQTGILNTINTSGIYSVTGTDGNGCASAANIGVTVNPNPNVTLADLGLACTNSGIIDLNQGRPAGGIYSGAGVSNNAFDPSTAGGTGSYAISYTYSDANGCSGNAIGTITVGTIPGGPEGIYGPVFGVCSNSTSVYSIDPINGALTFTWSVPGGVSITGGQGTNAITVSADNSFVSGLVSVTANNDCGSSYPVTTLVRSVPATPPVIFGDGNPCRRGTNLYWVDAVPGVNYYNWTVPSGSNILSGQGTDTILVSTGPVSGDITVNITNPCGTSNAATLSVNVNCRLAEAATTPAENHNLVMTAYPNPAHDLLNVLFISDNESNYTLKVFDMTGRVIIDQANKAVIGDNIIKLNFDGAKGIYLISLTSGGLNKQSKVILE